MDHYFTGLKLAAVYGYTPCRLGYCGRGNASSLQVLRQLAQDNDVIKNKAREILSTFTAAYAYYCLIASQNSINDPFAKEVVEAYWLGNNLLTRVRSVEIRQMILSDFVKPGLLNIDQAQVIANKLKANAPATHLFHVMCVGSVSGRIDLEPKLYDICRISWGQVLKIDQVQTQKESNGQSRTEIKVIVKYQPLVKANGRWQLGKFAEKEIIWDTGLIAYIQPGDTISFHWSRVCQVLNPNEVKNLKYYTNKLLSYIHKL